jgi:hypothetical protein
MNVKLCGILQCVLLLKVYTIYTYTEVGRAIAQAVSRWLPTAATRVRARVSSCGIVVGKVAMVKVFYVYFGLPFHSSFHQLLHNHHHLSSGAGTIGQ